MCFQTATAAMEIISIVLLELATMRNISLTLHVLEFLLEDSVQALTNVAELKLASTENVAPRY